MTIKDVMAVPRPLKELAVGDGVILYGDARVITAMTPDDRGMVMLKTAPHPRATNTWHAPKEKSIRMGADWNVYAIVPEELFMPNTTHTFKIAWDEED